MGLSPARVASHARPASLGGLMLEEQLLDSFVLLVNDLPCFLVDELPCGLTWVTAVRRCEQAKRKGAPRVLGHMWRFPV